MARLLRTMAATLGLAALPAAGARANVSTFAGTTSQSRPASVAVRPDGAVQLVSIGWTAGCRRSGSSYAARSAVSRFTRASPEAFAAVGRTHARLRHGERAAVTVRLAGRRRSPYVWTGSIAAYVVVRHGGRVVDVCRLRHATWRSTIPDVHLTAVTDQGPQALGPPGLVSMDSATPGSAELSGDPRGIVVGVANFEISFGVPRGQRLRPGAYTAARDRAPGTSPVLDIDWGGTSCTWATGTFTIHSIRFDRRGRVRAVAVDFDEHCEGLPAGTHGSLTARWP